MTLEEHTSLMHRWAERECEELLGEVDTAGVEVGTHCEPDLRMHPAPIIIKQAVQRKADLIVIGARGRSGAAGVLLGTVTEQMMQQSDVPVFAVKKKGECLGILRALLTLAG
jgi:nucleotide-binding universal stress UspA family protein